MDDIIPINDSLFYSKIKNCYVIHNLNETQSEDLLDKLDIGSWILRKDYRYGIDINAITIKINDGFVHHSDFYFTFNSKYDVYILNKRSMFLEENKKDKKILYDKTFDTMREYLLYLSNIYDLNIDKQIIYEDD